MNYIYDILLNFNTVAYDFFEWNHTDKVTHIRKIPLLKISTDKLSMILNYDIKFESEFLEKIKGKTEAFCGKTINNIEYACIFSDGESALAIMYKNNCLLKSKLLVDEEEDVLSICRKVTLQDITLKKCKKTMDNYFKTRKQLDSEKYIQKQLKKIYYDKNYETLRYMYYECFNKKEDDINHIVKRLRDSLNKDNTVIDKIKEFLKLLEIKH